MGTSVARFQDDGRRAVRPHRPPRHGSIRWWRGEINIGGVVIEIQASPEAMTLPWGVSMDDDLKERVEAFVTEKARQLNRRGGGNG